MILASWRVSTKKQYSTYLKQFEVFCKARGKSVMNADFRLGLDFLYELHSKGLSYSAVNTARSALSSVLITDQPHVDFGMHKIVCRFMKGVYNSRPSLPRYSAIWDPDVVLRYLSILSPRHRLSLKSLTLKVVMLLALLSAQRVQTLHCITLDVISFTSDSVQLAVDVLLKTSRPNWHLEPMLFKRYDDRKSLCIFRYLKTYIERTKEIRKDERHLLISYMKPHNRVTKSTISRWIRTVMAKSGVDISIFKAHSTRAASSSKAAQYVAMDKILKAGGWSSESCYLKHYNLCRNSDNSVPNAVLHDV